MFERMFHAVIFSGTELISPAEPLLYESESNAMTFAASWNGTQNEKRYGSVRVTLVRVSELPEIDDEPTEQMEIDTSYLDHPALY